MDLVRSLPNDNLHLCCLTKHCCKIILIIKWWWKLFLSMDICENQAQRDAVRDFSSSGRKPPHLSPLSPTSESRKVTACFFFLFSMWCFTAVFGKAAGSVWVGSVHRDVIPEEVSPSSQMCGSVHVWGGGWEGPPTATPLCPPAPRRSRSPSRGSEEWSRTINRLILELIIYNSGCG